MTQLSLVTPELHALTKGEIRELPGRSPDPDVGMNEKGWTGVQLCVSADEPPSMVRYAELQICWAPGINMSVWDDCVLSREVYWHLAPVPAGHNQLPMHPQHYQHCRGPCPPLPLFTPYQPGEGSAASRTNQPDCLTASFPEPSDSWTPHYPIHPEVHSPFLLDLP